MPNFEMIPFTDEDHVLIQQAIERLEMYWKNVVLRADIAMESHVLNEAFANLSNLAQVELGMGRIIDGHVGAPVSEEGPALGSPDSLDANIEH